nr:lysylphosphatidylglycerol synthase domain-containing protein [Spirosoma spitsbergense]
MNTVLGLLQSNVFLSVLSLNSGKKIIFWTKIAVFALLLVYIGYVLRQQPFDWTVLRKQLRTVEHPEWWAIGLCTLTPVNWGLEALKWWILLQRVEKTSFGAAYSGVLAGVSLGFALPAQLGDTAGRVLSLRDGKRGSAIGASLVSGGMQFYVALVMGTIAWAYHIRLVPDRNSTAGWWLLVLLGTLSVGGVVFGLIRTRLLTWLSGRAGLKRFATYWNVAGLYSDREIALALLVATLRYGVFAIQFYLALRVVGIVMEPNVAASGIGLVFLVKTVTPAFNLLSDLGVREAAALWVFAPFGLSVPVMITATLLLWFANILLPVLVGLYWVWKLKLTAE